MALILNNSFSKDSYSIRNTRLQEIQFAFPSVQPDIGAPADIVTWAATCHDNWMAAWVAAGQEKGEKEGAFLLLSEKDEDLIETYTDIRLVIIADYENDLSNLKDFKIDRPFPDIRDQRVKWVRKIVSISETHRAAGNPHALPVAMTDRLTAAADAVEAAYEAADQERLESEQATRALYELFDSDSDVLRKLYARARAAWGRYDLRFEIIGMVPSQKRTGGGQPDAPQNLEYDSVLSRFSWLAAEGATSYQLAYRDSGSKDDWEEAYKGSDTTVVFNPGGGNWQFRVRARNENGYGDWSNTITVEIVGGIPAPDWVKAEYSGVPPGAKVTAEQVEVTWGNVAAATMYEVWRSVVKLDDPAGDFTMIGEIDNEMYLDFDLKKNKRNYYYIIAKNDTDRSEPSVTAYDDIVD